MDHPKSDLRPTRRISLMRQFFDSGASGGMMGLLGGLVGFLLVGWLQHRTERTRRPLLFLLVIIALQTAFDLSTPNVSFACHALGLATGAVFGTLWTWLTRR